MSSSRILFLHVIVVLESKFTVINFTVINLFDVELNFMESIVMSVDTETSIACSPVKVAVSAEFCPGYPVEGVQFAESFQFPLVTVFFQM